MQSYIGGIEEEKFKAQVAAAKVTQARVAHIVQHVFAHGVHFGSATGGQVGKDTLLKPGADVGIDLLGLVADPKVEVTINPEDSGQPEVIVNARVEAHEGSLDGPVVCVGVGAANTWEKKWRRVNDWDNKTPKGKPTKIINPDPYDLQNNVVKYAVKRATVDLAIRLGFGAYFVQDLDDAGGDKDLFATKTPEEASASLPPPVKTEKVKPSGGLL